MGCVQKLPVSCHIFIKHWIRSWIVKSKEGKCQKWSCTGWTSHLRLVSKAVSLIVIHNNNNEQSLTYNMINFWGWIAESWLLCGAFYFYSTSSAEVWGSHGWICGGRFCRTSSPARLPLECQNKLGPVHVVLFDLSASKCLGTRRSPRLWLAVSQLFPSSSADSGVGPFKCRLCVWTRPGWTVFLVASKPGAHWITAVTFRGQLASLRVNGAVGGAGRWASPCWLEDLLKVSMEWSPPMLNMSLSNFWMFPQNTA